MVDNLILFDKSARVFNSNGLGFLSEATKCVVEEERNGVFELELEYPMSGRRFSDLQLRNIIFAKPNPYDEPQPFRIYQISKPIKGIISVRAKHISYDLSDYVCLPFLSFNSSGEGRWIDNVYFPSVMEALRSEHVTWTRTSPVDGHDVTMKGSIYDPDYNASYFVFSTDMSLEFQWNPATDKDGNVQYDEHGEAIYNDGDDHRFKFFKPGSVRSVMGDNKDCGILGKFINSNTHSKCEFKTWYHWDALQQIGVCKIEALNQRGSNRGFEIRYGKNMTNLDHSETADKDYTEIFPFWKSVNSDNTTVKIMNSEMGYSPTVPVVEGSSPGYRKILVRDLSSDFDNEPKAEDMKRYAKDYIEDEELKGIPTTNITVNFQELSKSSEYSKYKVLEEVQLCDIVKIIHEGLGISADKKVIKTVYDVLAEQYTSIDLGDPWDELATTISNNTTVTNISADAAFSMAEQAIGDIVKKITTIYYVDTHNLGVNNLPDPALVTIKLDPNITDEWISVEPTTSHEGVLYTAQQKIVASGKKFFEKPEVAKVVNTVKGFIDDVKDGAGNVINNTLNGNKITNETVGSSAITTSAVTTCKISDGAVTHDKIAVNALYSNNFSAYADWSTTSTYHSGDTVYYPASSANTWLYKCIVSTATTGSFVYSVDPEQTEWQRLDSNVFSESGTFFDLQEGIISSKNFAIDRNGNAAFNGTIYASAGQIGGLIIDQNGLSNADVAYSSNELQFGNGLDNYFKVLYSSDFPGDDTTFTIKAQVTGGLSHIPTASLKMKETDPFNPDFMPSYADGGELDGYWTFSESTILADHPSETISEWISRVENSSGSIPVATSSILGGVKVAGYHPIITVAGNGEITLDVSEDVDNGKFLRYDGDGDFSWGAALTPGSPLPWAQVDGDASSSTTIFTASVPGITSYRNGTSFWLKNGTRTSASGFTININGLGAKKVYSNMAMSTRDTTIFNVNYTMLFVYDEHLDYDEDEDVYNGGFLCYRGYDSNTNTIGYQLRTSSTTLPVVEKTYRYRLLFSSPDNTKFIPANISTATNSTTARTVYQSKINPFGKIVYYGTTASVPANTYPAQGSLWTQYNLNLGYSYNINGGTLALTPGDPVYIKCAPQDDGSAIVDSTTPYVTSLPATSSINDGKIYIHLGYVATSSNATTPMVELMDNHQVYAYRYGTLQPWTPPEAAVKYGGSIYRAPIMFGSSGLANVYVTPPTTSNPYTFVRINATSSTPTCLISGTKIKMSDFSEKNIEDVEVGDIVKSYDLSKGDFIDSVVVSNEKTGEINEYVSSLFDDGSTLVTYGKHNVYNKTLGYPIDINDFRPGDKTLNAEGETIDFIESTNYFVRKRIRVPHYQLVVSNNLYFANGILNGAKVFSKYRIFSDRGMEVPKEILDVGDRQEKLTDDSIGFTTSEDYIKEVSPKLIRKKRLQHEIDDAKKNLSDTDYIVQKYTEGLIDDEKWKKSKSDRGKWREKINANEPEINDLNREISKIKRKHRTRSMTSKERFEACCKLDNDAFELYRNWLNKGGEK